MTNLPSFHLITVLLAALVVVVSHPKKTFLISPCLVRDILETLKECLTHCNSAVGETYLAVQQRMNQLSQYVNEALWRLQLIEPDVQNAKFGAIDESLYKTCATSNDDVLRDSPHYESASTEMSDSSSGTGRQRQRSTRHSKRNEPCVIERLLATPYSLLNMCLKKGRYIEAQQVVKMFNLSDTHGSAEVTFVHKYEQLLQKLHTVSFNRHLDLKDSHEVATKYDKHPTLSTIGSSIQTSDETIFTIVDQFLSTTTLPTFTEETLQAVRKSKSPLLQYIEPEQIPLMTLFDLLCSSATGRKESVKLLGMIESRLQTTHSSKEHRPDSDHSDTEPLGLRGFYKLLKDITALPDTGNKSVHDILQDSTLPLNATDREIVTNCLTAVDKAVEKANSFVNCPPGSEFSVKYKEHKREELLSAMQELIATLDTHVPRGGLTSFMLQSSNNSEENIPYVKKFYDHIKKLNDLMSKYNAEIDKDGKPIDVLDHTITSLFGKLIFEHGVAPSMLEDIADDLNIDIVSVIMNSCCSALQSSHTVHPGSEQHTTDDNTTCTDLSQIVLNRGTTDTECTEDPEVLVRSILSSLITLLKENSSTSVDICRLATSIQSHDYKSVLVQTHKLQHINIAALTTTEQTMCFYINLFNLITAHSWIWNVEYLLKQGVNIEADSLSDSMDHILQHTSMCYHVGQLGVISLADLKYLLVNNFGAGSTYDSILNTLQESGLRQIASDYTIPSKKDLVFCLSEGSISSQYIQVFKPDTVSHDIEASMIDYIESAVFVNNEDNIIFVPEYLLWYQYLDCEIDSTTEQKFMALVDCISSHVTKEKRQNISEIVEKKADLSDVIRVIEHSYQMSYSFNVQQFTQHAETLRNTYHTRDGNKMNESDNEDTNNIMKSASYGTTPTIFQYIKDKSPIAATLFCLLGKQVEDSAASDFENSTERVVHSQLTLIDEYCNYSLTHLYPNLKLYIEHSLSEMDDILKTIDDSRNENELLGSIARQLFMSNVTSNEVNTVMWDAAVKLFKKGEFEKLKRYLNLVPDAVREQSHRWYALQDLNYCTLIHKHPGDNKLLTQCILLIKDNRIRIRTLLSCLQYCDIDSCVYLLQYGTIDKVGLPNHLAKLLDQQVEKMFLYKKLIDHIASVESKLQASSSGEMPHDNALDDASDSLQSGTLSINTVSQLRNWKYLETLSNSSPEVVLETLLYEQHNYTSVRDWAKLHNVDPGYIQQIEQSHLTSLLNSDEHNYIEVLLIFENLYKYDSNMCQTVCFYLIQTLSKKENALFVAEYLLKHATKELPMSARQNVGLTVIGCKILLCIPEHQRKCYEHLISEPLLILEQTLMNMKIEWAKDMLSTLPEQLKLEHLASLDLKLSLALCDELIIKYGTKALEFPVLQFNASDSFTRSSSAISSPTIGRSLIDIPGAASKSSLTTTSPRRKSSIPIPTTCTTSSTRNSHIGSCSPRSQSSPLTGESPHQGASKLSCPADLFVMPREPPNKEDWVPDLSTDVCMVCCNEQFSMFNRRHHCRRCGRVVCATCSTKTTMIKNKSSRTCDQCYAQMFEPRHDSVEERRKILQSKFSGEGGSPCLSQDGTTESLSHDFDEPVPTVLTENHKILTLNTEEDDLIREEFYYQQAPSTSLCLSILDLHSNDHQCADLLLDLCDSISKYLKCNNKGKSHSEIDVGLIISMLRYLLFSAKMKYQKTPGSYGTDQCDLFLGRVELLEKLVAANVSYIPTMQQLTQMDMLRRLRDKLIEDERLPLAMEVSTRCGIDPVGVWAAWGMSCLQLNNYPTAREKFAKCLKVPVDRNQGQNPPLLNEIVEFLQKPPFNMEISLKPPIVTKSLNNAHTQECLYYLTTYGRYYSIIKFYRNFNSMNLAAQFVLDKNVRTDVFIDSFLKPSMTSGQLLKFLDSLSHVDPNLTQWNTYITAMCRYLNKNKFFHVLYQVQIFTKDFIRAAMTCISCFYQQGCTTYTDLNKKVGHLQDAKHHLEHYMEQNRSRSRSTSGSRVFWGQQTPGSSQSESSIQLFMTPSDVNKYITTVNLQIEITKYFCRYLDNFEQGFTDTIGLYVSNTTGERTPVLPTLFGSTKMKSHIVSLVLLSGNNVNDGFGLAFRIIQDFKLDSSSIYVQTGKQFASREQYASINQLLQCIMESGLGSDTMYDSVLCACIDVVVDKSTVGKDLESMIKQLKSDANKIDAYISCGKLRSAYLIAVKSHRVVDVERIALAADRLQQSAVKSICAKWLQQNR